MTDDFASPHADAAVLRILDANANRGAEGLRVVEEFVRFVLDDRHLTALCKQLRHDLAEAMRRLPASGLLAARETQADVGTTITAGAEFDRATARDVAVASMKRVEQSLRCLEEYGKTVSAEFAAAVEALRYRAYTLHRAVAIADDSRARLQGARLYVLIDGAATAGAFAVRAQSLVAAGVHVLQLRDKRLTDRELLARARMLRQITAGTSTLFVLNDRPDLAALAHADGVHVGQDELSVKEVRAIVGPEMLIGVSTHSIEQARRAVLDGANYLGCGPTFPSGTKEFREFPGIDFLRQVSQEISLPAFAIGGITAENLRLVRAAGFCRVAVSGAVADATEPVAAARQLLAWLAE